MRRIIPFCGFALSCVSVFCLTATAFSSAPGPESSSSPYIASAVLPSPHFEVKGSDLLPEFSAVPLEGDLELKSLGVFTIYSYCPCTKCCGQWSGGPTASGVMPVEGRTIAADWDVLPAGTEVFINDHKYIVEDTGSGIVGNKIDIFMDSHQDALNWGVQELEVFYVSE